MTEELKLVLISIFGAILTAHYFWTRKKPGVFVVQSQTDIANLNQQAPEDVTFPRGFAETISNLIEEPKKEIKSTAKKLESQYKVVYLNSLKGGTKDDYIKFVGKVSNGRVEFTFLIKNSNYNGNWCRSWHLLKKLEDGKYERIKEVNGFDYVLEDKYKKENEEEFVVELVAMTIPYTWKCEDGTTFKAFYADDFDISSINELEELSRGQSILCKHGPLTQSQRKSIIPIKIVKS